MHNKEEIQKKTDQIEKIYQDYQVKLNQFKSRQNVVIKKFIKQLEKEKLKKLRNLLK